MFFFFVKGGGGLIASAEGTSIVGGSGGILPPRKFSNLEAQKRHLLFQVLLATRLVTSSRLRHYRFSL